MFEALTERLEGIFSKLARRGIVREKDIEEAVRDIKLSLLEADVNLNVVNELTERIRERAKGERVLKSLTPVQQVVKIVRDELVRVLGERDRSLELKKRPSCIMLVGLQGSGKTTTSAKLALFLKKRGEKPILASLDPYRPAAGEQLSILAKSIDVPYFVGRGSVKDICGELLNHARDKASVIIADTAGRLHIDEELMKELGEMKEILEPDEVILIADAMTGQEAVRIAEEFHKKINLTGIILTKMEGDARGGAALSMTWVTGVPIKFIGVGEKLKALEPFHPDRMAQRILGMGDVLTLIEKAESVIDERKALEYERKIKEAKFDFEDFLEQLRAIRRMGSLTELLELIPGLGGMMRKLPVRITDRDLRRVEAIILSMTREERKKPWIIDFSRKRRIARGSGTTIQEVNALLSQFKTMEKLMKEFKKGKLPFKFLGGGI